MSTNLKVKINNLFPKQHAIVYDILYGDHKFSVIRATRQSGKTEALLTMLVPLAARASNQIGVYMSADSTKNQRAYERAMKLIPLRLIESHRQSPCEINFINGTKIIFISALSGRSNTNNNNAAIGTPVDFFLCDEAALYPDGLIKLLTPTVAAKKKAKFVIASTPRGKNDFYYKCLEGQDQANKFIKEYRMNYNDNPYYDLDQLAYEKKTMSEQWFKQEYEAEFIFGSSKVFGDFSEYQTVTAWQKDPIPGESYYAGIDWSGEGDDDTIVAIQNQSGKYVHFYRIDEVLTPDQVKLIKEILHKWNCNTYTERNGLGKGGSDYLEQDEKIGHKITKFWMSQDNKSDLLSEFLFDIRSGIIQLPTPDLCSELDNQMSIFQSTRSANGKLSYSHPNGAHDDYVDAMLLANKARKDSNTYTKTHDNTISDDNAAKEYEEFIKTNPSFMSLKKKFNITDDYEDETIDEIFAEF